MWDLLRSRVCCPWLTGRVGGSRHTDGSVFVLPRLPGTACAMAGLDLSGLRLFFPLLIKIEQTSAHSFGISVCSSTPPATCLRPRNPAESLVLSTLELKTQTAAAPFLTNSDGRKCIPLMHCSLYIEDGAKLKVSVFISRDLPGFGSRSLIERNSLSWQLRSS